MTEKEIELDVFNNLEKYIGKYKTKHRQFPLTPLCLKKIGQKLEIPNYYYRTLKRPDIVAELEDGQFMVVEIKKNRKEHDHASEAIGQVLMYNMILNKMGINPVFCIICDKISSTLKEFVEHYKLEIELIKYEF